MKLQELQKLQSDYLTHTHTYPSPVSWRKEKCPRVDGSLTAGIFGLLWAEVVATIQNPLNATTATGRGLWDRTILLSKGIRAQHGPFLSLSVCVCVANDQITRTGILIQRRLYRDDVDGWDWNFKWSVNWAYSHSICSYATKILQYTLAVQSLDTFH